MTVWVVKRNNHGYGIVLAICATKDRALRYLKRVASRESSAVYWVQREKVLE